MHFPPVPLMSPTANEMEIPILPRTKSWDTLAFQFLEEMNNFRIQCGFLPLNNCNSLSASSLLAAIDCARRYSVEKGEQENRPRIGLETIRIRNSETTTTIRDLFYGLLRNDGRFWSSVLDRNMRSVGVSVFGSQLCHFIVVKLFWE